MCQALQLPAYLTDIFLSRRTVHHLQGQVDSCNGGFELMGDVGEIFGEILPGCEGCIPCLVSEGYRFIDFILQLGKFVLLFP